MSRDGRMKMASIGFASRLTAYREFGNTELGRSIRRFENAVANLHTMSETASLKRVREAGAELENARRQLIIAAGATPPV